MIEPAGAGPIGGPGDRVRRRRARRAFRPWMWWGTVGIWGALIGSFLNVCIARWPMELSVGRPAVSMPALPAPDQRGTRTCPMLSWLALGGQCRGCRLRISVQYPAVELGNRARMDGGLCRSIHRHSRRFARGGVCHDPGRRRGHRSLVLSDPRWVHRVSALPGSSCPRRRCLLGRLGGFATPYDALIGACVGAGAISIVGWLGEVALRKEAMGFGDVTLMAVSGRPWDHSAHCSRSLSARLSARSPFSSWSCRSPGFAVGGRA